MTLFVVGVRRDGAVALWSHGAREATGLDRPGSLANLPFAHTSDRRKALQEVRRIADGGAPRPFALSLRARHGFVSLVMQNVNDISGTVAATFIGTPIDASLLTLATDGTHLKNAEFLTTGSHVSSWACAVPVAESVAEASNVHEVGRAPPLPGIEERSETNASLFDRRSVVWLYSKNRRRTGRGPENGVAGALHARPRAPAGLSCWARAKVVCWASSIRRLYHYGCIP